MHNIKVSVIIPVYNEECYLQQCLDSVCAQTLQGIEIICIDDGSTDRSLEILYACAAREPRMKVFTQKNCYAGAARNLGMAHARGEYISFLDADDYFSPFLLERMYAAAEGHASDVVICNIYHCDAMTGETWERMSWDEEKFCPAPRKVFSRDMIPEQLFQITNGWAWDKLFRRSFIQAADLMFSDTRVANDGYFVYMALAVADRVVKIEDYLVTQRVNNVNSLANTREDSWFCGVQMLYDIKNGLEQTGLYHKLEKTFLNFSLKYLIWAFEDLKTWKARKAMYCCIREECNDRLGILKMDSSFYYYTTEYELYSEIIMLSFDEYLIKKLEDETQICEKYKEWNRRLAQKVEQKVWLFPYEEVKKDSSIVLYGAGRVGEDYYRQIMASGYCQVSLWMDQRFQGEERKDTVQGWFDEMEQRTFDRIVIALLRKKDAEEAIALLKKHGIKKDAIVWKTGMGESLCR